MPETNFVNSIWSAYLPTWFRKRNKSKQDAYDRRSEQTPNHRVLNIASTGVILSL